MTGGNSAAPDAELFGPPGPFYGNEFFHILELTPIESGYRAYVCDGLYNIYREGTSGQVRIRRRLRRQHAGLRRRRRHEGVAGGVHRYPTGGRRPGRGD